jgi:aerobic carbon-monoxide dehydrogenase small subunit
MTMHYDISITVNDVGYQTRVAADVTLMRLLRDHLHLGGTKEGCGIGECGACCVRLDGKLVNACLVLAVEASGGSVRTIEGEAKGDQLSDLQQAFIDHHALQCGFCTPGMIMAASDLLARTPSPTDDQIVEALAGSLCRCTGYETAIAAVRAASRGRKGGGQ